ncbi:DUF350 domain-containing protein [Terracoccus luteus]|jgi:hypothetical protein|uniref:Uncharacterized protein DUF350 n=1 Tax=Terracoccus luteus TaxID=53356 RepID=A0A495XU75_9MICO|nr:DUF350 domain-containing protein [Terracoccus luteus]MBB2985259.1 hypothetical protein [Terracoccus luteus]MCP2170911.1 hypothetical protein [Terracoccus luteus]RKT77482.1 uncharacterized protein DUF350 [Terracoccus luteus]
MDLMDLTSHVGYAAAYAAVGIVMLGLGYLALDVLTPGHLGRHIWVERSVNAAVVLGAGFVGLGGIVFTAIWTNGESGFGSALVWTVVFGLLGVLLQAAAFRLLDLVTPGDMAAMVVEKAFHPACVVAAAVQVAVSLVVTASIA